MSFFGGTGFIPKKTGKRESGEREGGGHGRNSTTEKSRAEGSLPPPRLEKERCDDRLIGNVLSSIFSGFC